MLIKCKECQKEISTDAKKCPECGANNSDRKLYTACPDCGKGIKSSQKHCGCGAKNPGYISPKAMGIGCAVIIVIALIFGVINSCTQSPEEKRKDQVNKHFSPWNGSHMKFVEAVKTQLNDPSSFEHVETGYIDYGKNLQIKMKFRGKNSYNAVITTTAIGLVDAETGEVKKCSIKQ